LAVAFQEKTSVINAEQNSIFISQGMTQLVFDRKSNKASIQKRKTAKQSVLQQALYELQLK